MPIQLTYAINTIPNPLTANTPGGKLELIATNGTGAPVTIIGINIGIPVGTETDGLALTSVPAQIGPNPPAGWSMGYPMQSPGLYTFVFTPPNNSPITIPAGGSLVFVLTYIAVNVSGTATVIVTEGNSTGLWTLPIPVSKFPAGWGDVTFTAESSNAPNGVYVTLGWGGPAGAVYTIQYLDPATQQPVTIPAAGGTALSNSGTYPGPKDPPLNISATTVFTLWVKATIFGQQYETEAQQTVVVGQIPAITGFTGTMTGAGDSLQLNLTWQTTNAEFVEGSWTSNLQAPNHTTAVIYPPFKQCYSITAINGLLPSEPVYLYLSWMVYPKPITVGNNPSAIAITPGNMYAFVVNPGSVQNNGTVSVIDVKNLAITQTITVGYNPSAIAITPDGNYAFVANTNDVRVSVIDVNNLEATPQTIGVGRNPLAIAITPDNNYAFVVNPCSGQNNGTVSVIDINNLATTPQTIGVGSLPQAIAITPDGKFAFVVNNLDSTVSVIDINTLTVLPQTITVGYQSTAIAITPDSDFVFVLSPGLQVVYVIDVNNLAALPKKIYVGNLPQAIAITPDNRYAFVPNLLDGTLSVIDVKNLAAAPQTITVGFALQSIAITPDGKFAYVTYYQSQIVSIINVNKLTATPQTITVGSWPNAIAITPDELFAFVANSSDGTVSVLGWGLPSE